MARNRRRSRIDANDLAGYGSVANGTVDVDKAARGLGASKTEVRQAIRQAEAAQSNTFYRRISGRREADSAEGTSTRGMLQAVFGRGPRGGAVNARAAAQSLGWVSGEQGVGGYEQGYARDRRVDTDISPSEIEAMIDTALRQLIAHQQHHVIESALPILTSQRHTPILAAPRRQTRSGTPKPGH